MGSDITVKGSTPASSLVEWDQAGIAAHDLAAKVIGTPFVPERFKNLNDATAAALVGASFGFSPFTSWQNIYVVHGQAALYSRTMVALVQSQGHQVWVEESTDERVVVCGQRKGSEHVERSEWTLQRAVKAGYASNQKYKSSPREMLYAKAAAEVCRHVAADVLLGIPYTVEDLDLENRETQTVARSEKPIKRTVRRKRVQEPEPVEPEMPESVPEDDVQAGVVDETAQPALDEEAPHE